MIDRNEGGRCSRFVLLAFAAPELGSAELGTLIVDKKQTRALSIGRRNEPGNSALSDHRPQRTVGLNNVDAMKIDFIKAVFLTCKAAE